MSLPTERLSFLPDFPDRETLYHPLDANKDEIRVITIRPSNDRSSIIHCFLQTISIKEGRSNRYDAVSYFWGSTETTDTIVVHNGLSVDQPDCGVEVPIPYALTGALRQFRAIATESERPLVLWTDAVCIHQLDAAERSEQVTIMQRIYQSASSVLIWLGEDDASAELGLANLIGLAMCRQISVIGRDHALDAFDYYNFNAELHWESLERVDAILRNLGKPGGFDTNCRYVSEMGAEVSSWMNTISALLDLSYWYRGWTFQEACANKLVFLHYGQARCRVRNWGSLHDILFEQSDLSAWLKARRITRTMSDFALWVLAAVSASSPYQSGFPTTENLSSDLVFEWLRNDLLTLARPTRRTADPRDQVYSQLGCMSSLRYLNMKPDYTLTTEQVFIKTTLAILRASQSWAHGQFFTPSESPFMPSWAIDFTMTPDQEIDEWQHLFRCRDFQADSGASFRIREAQSGSLLTAGFIYDDVVIVEPYDRGRRKATCIDWFHTLSSSADSWQYLFRSNSQLTREDLWGSFCRTVCVGMVDTVKFGPQHATACGHWISGNHELLGEDWASVLEEMSKRELDLQTGPANFIVTRNGHLGLVPGNVNVGDRIAILATGPIPFVLQKVGEQNNHRDAYILRGSCYVDGKALIASSPETGFTNVELIGIMYGEAVRERARDVYETRRRCDPDFWLWKRKHRGLIGRDADLGELSFSSDLAFLDDICLV